jgi:hypothetical protein
MVSLSRRGTVRQPVYLVLQHELDGDKRQATVGFSGQPGQRVDYCGRDHWNWWLAASGRRLGARHDVDVDDDRRIGHVRRDIVVKVPLLYHALLERDRALRHQLRQAERHTRLEHALDAERVDREAAVSRNRRAVNPGPLVLD